MSDVTGLEMRQVYAKVVASLAAEHPGEVYALEADLSSSMSTRGLAGVLGPNYVDVGIMEAHMVSMAAGLSITGGYAFVHSFGQFLARRAMDQVFVSLAYSGLSACLVGSDAGVTAEHNGGTHMTFEDMGIIRVIPDVTIFEVCDPVQFEAALCGAYQRRGLTYIRTIRKQPKREVYPAGTSFGTAGARVLREGSDVTLIATGIEVAEALDAAEALQRRGIGADVIDAFRVEPLDVEVVVRSARKTRAVVTCENHNVINGLGSAVAETLAETRPTLQYRIGVRKLFGQVGTTAYLMDFYGLTAESIADAAEKLVDRVRLETR